jgi:Cu(I)/Ag(I) efflux system membrane fusion protein
MTAGVTLPYLPGRRFEATVEYVYPYLEGATRTGRVRLTLENPNGALKPDMYAEVALQADLGERLSVPEEAVIIAGESRVVFVDLGEGRLKPARIRTGRRAQGFIEVLDGLSAGDTVVTSGNFLLAAETRLKTGIGQW